MEGPLSERTHIARKNYDCTICGGTIWEGDEYTRAFWKPEDSYRRDKPIDAKLCFRCHTPAHLPRNGSDGYESVRRQYGVPARLGMKVFCRGTYGTLLRGDLTHNSHLVVKVAGLSANRPEFWHPTWETVYYADDWQTILADYRAKKAGITCQA